MEKRDLFKESAYDPIDNVKRYQSHSFTDRSITTLCLQNLELEEDETFLNQIFAKYGRIKQIKRRAIYFPDQLEAEILAYITYEELASAKLALESIQQQKQYKFTSRYGNEPESELANLYKVNIIQLIIENNTSILTYISLKQLDAISSIQLVLV